jgi:tetratricopeptide (TPR) repeat protein
MKIAVYAVAKNEEQFVDRFCEAASSADLILIADTGSGDQTINKALKHEKTSVGNIWVKPWRFDKARDAALALIPPDIDVCISLDLDEVLQPGWRAEIEKVWKLGETTRLRYLFDWGVGIQFYYEKIHARFGYHWHHPCHEYPRPDGRITEVYATTDALLAVHRPDNTKSRGQYLDILKLSVEEDPICPRNAFYYARELSFHAQWQEAIKECHRYLALPGATWVNERCYAYRVIGRCFKELGDSEKAYGAFLQAASEAPNTREPWFELSDLMRAQNRYEEGFAFAKKCLSITDKEKVYTVDPSVWAWKPHDNLAICAHYLGMRNIAIEHGKNALDLGEPAEMPRLIKNMEFYLGAGTG